MQEKLRIVNDKDNKAVLQAHIEREIMLLQHIQQEMTMDKRKEYLSKHPYKIWQGCNNKSWYTYLPDDSKPRGKRLVQKSTKAKVIDCIVNYWQNLDGNPTIEEVFHEWNDRRLELKKISGSTHARNEGFYNRHFNDFGQNRIKNISPEDWCNFLEEQIPKYDLSAKAFSGLKGIVRGFLKRAKRTGLISYNPDTLFSELDVDDSDFSKKVYEDDKEVFNEEESEKIIVYLLWNMDVRNMCILLMFITGMRVGEATTLKPEDIDEEFTYIKVRRTESREIRDGVTTRFVKDFPKTLAGVRTIVIPSQWKWFIERLYELSKDEEWVFLREDGVRLPEQSVYIRLQRICKHLDIKPKSPHKIRKTYASILLDNGIDHRFIIEQMGHTSIGVTERNYHRNRRSIEQKANILSEIPDFSLNLITSGTGSNYNHVTQSVESNGNCIKNPIKSSG